MPRNMDEQTIFSTICTPAMTLKICEADVEIITRWRCRNRLLVHVVQHQLSAKGIFAKQNYAVLR